jgi:ABC-type polysaccharide/polyol phosphate export permease
VRQNDGRSVDTAGLICSAIAEAGSRGLADIVGGARHWRVWHIIGIRDLRHRYARSKFGQLWLIISTATMIGAMATVWSLIWNQPLREMMPFIGIGLIMWTYLSQVITECTTVFTSQAGMYLNQRMNFSVSIFSIIYKNTIVLAHSSIITLALILIFGVPINWYDLQIVPAFILVWIGMLGLGYILAMICVRYRDIIQVVNSWLLVVFFVTPITWKPEFLGPEHRFIIDWNPFGQVLELLRNPLLGQPVSSHAWITTIVIGVGGVLLGLPVIGRYQRRMIFWM